VKAARQFAKTVDNMTQFFSSTKLGKALQEVSTKKNIGGRSVYIISETNTLGINKGYYYYLDHLHKDHLEVFDKQGKFVKAINLDGKLNKAKTAWGLKEGRTIYKK
jgi:filamentous hemagglutinin